MMPTDQNEQQHQFDENERILLVTGMSAALALFLASHAPAPLVALVLSNLLWWGAFGAAMVAAVTRQPFLDSTLTYWDQGLILLMLSLIAHNFVDPAAVHALLETAGAEAAPTAEPPGQGHS